MSLLDHFAGQVLSSIDNGTLGFIGFESEKAQIPPTEFMAKYCYDIAEKLLKERKLRLGAQPEFKEDRSEEILQLKVIIDYYELVDDSTMSVSDVYNAIAKKHHLKVGGVKSIIQSHKS